MVGSNILHNINPASYYIAGDAPVAAALNDHVATSMADVPLACNGGGAGGKTKNCDGGKGGGKGGGKVQKETTKPQWAPPAFDSKTFCNKFNMGACHKSKSADGRCPQRNDLFHACQTCGKMGHGASTCSMPRITASAKKKAKGGQNQGQRFGHD